MPKILDLSGQRFGRLEAIERTGSDHSSTFWRCRCACGAEKTVRSYSLRRGTTRSCGCIHREMAPRLARRNAPAPLDLAGQRFGRLVAIELTRHRGVTAWRCRCDCGATTTVTTNGLRMGNTRSCGCLYRETCSQTAKKYLGKGNPTHRLTRTPEHGVWATMLSRCRNPNSDRYAAYGGRGIRVCDRWLQFANFYADMGPRPEGVSPAGRALYSIHRIDNDGHYERNNCIWATMQEQMDARKCPAT